MRFHLSMMLVVIFVAMTMHAMASAATPGPAADPAQAGRRDAAVRAAGQTLNTQLNACKQEAARRPRASKRDLIACQREARKIFRMEIRQARAAK